MTDAQNPDTKKLKNELTRYVQRFLEYCEIEKNRSLKTIRNYEHYLDRFTEFANGQGITKPEQIDLELVRSFRVALNRLESEDGKHLKLITQNYHVIALRAFLKYLSKQDIKTLAPEKIELAKNPSRQVGVLDESELERVFKAVEQEPNELLRLRDKAILLVLFSTGVRISELTQLKTKSLNLDRGEFTVRGKGDKLRLVFLSTEACSALKLYLKKRTDNHPALFISHTKVGLTVTKEMEAFGSQTRKPANALTGSLGLTARSIQRLVHKYAMLAGITHKVSPHTFRHSFATDLLRNGADIRSVQSMLGHSSITTTQIYTHITNEGLRDIHKKFHAKK